MRSSRALVAATYQRQVRSRSSSAFSALRAASYPRRLCSEHRAIESAAAAIEDGALWSLDLSHGVDWHDDWPFQPFSRVHGVKRNRLFLSVWATFNGPMARDSSVQAAVIASAKARMPRTA